jgi:hypothetical protein
LPRAAGALARVVTLSLAFVVLYLAAVVLLHQGLAPLRQAVELLRGMIPWDKRRSTAVRQQPEFLVPGE